VVVSAVRFAPALALSCVLLKFLRWGSGGSSYLSSHPQRLILGLGHNARPEVNGAIHWFNGPAQTVSGLRNGALSQSRAAAVNPTFRVAVAGFFGSGLRLRSFAKLVLALTPISVVLGQTDRSLAALDEAAADFAQGRTAEASRSWM